MTTDGTISSLFTHARCSESAYSRSIQAAELCTVVTNLLRSSGVKYVAVAPDQARRAGGVRLPRIHAVLVMRVAGVVVGVVVLPDGVGVGGGKGEFWTRSSAQL